MDTSIIVALVSGGCAISSLLIERILKFDCSRNKIEDNKEESTSRNCFIDYRCCKRKIPYNPRPVSVLNKVFEPPFNCYNVNKDKNKMKYCRVLSDNSYLVDIEPRIHLINNGKVVEDGNVNIYKEFTNRTESGYYYLQAEINHIIRDNVKLFVKRFDKDWNFIGKIEYIEAVNGVNKLKAKCEIGNFNICFEQVGIQVFCYDKEMDGNAVCIINKVYLDDKPLSGFYLF